MLKSGTITENNNSLYIPTEVREDFDERQVKLLSVPKLLLIFPKDLDHATISANLKLLREELELRISNHKTTTRE